MRFTGILTEKNGIQIDTRLSAGSFEYIKKLLGDSFKIVSNLSDYYTVEINREFILYERVKFQQGYLSYNSVVNNNFIVWDFDNVSIDDELFEESLGDILVALMLVDGDGRVLSNETLGISRKVDEYLTKLVTEGALSSSFFGFDFVDLDGKAISQRSRSVTLKPMVENIIKHYIDNYKESSYEHINQLFELMFSSLEAFVLIRENPTSLKILRNPESKYCLLLKPVTHLAIFELFMKYENTDKLNQIIDCLNTEDFSISSKWVGILLTENLSVVSKSKEHFVQYLEARIR